MDSKDIVIESFVRIYGEEPLYTLFTPYRVSPFGAHVDHNLGLITGFAIDKGIYLAYTPRKGGIIEVSSLQFDGHAVWNVFNVPNEKQDDWADYLMGATISLYKRHPFDLGLSCVINGELPIGGLSSSASVIISFIDALCDINKIELTRKELVEISKEAENSYVGVSCGKLDQSCEIYSRKDKLFFMDLKDESYKLVDAPSNMKPYAIGIFFSGLDRTLVNSNFNVRVDELRGASFVIKALSGMEYGNFNDNNMRDVPRDVFDKYKDKLPLSFAKRAEYFYSECERAERSVLAFQNGDIEEFGRLINDSGDNFISNWETCSSEIIKLFEAVKSCEGVYGARPSGAGFKGCCVAIINPDYAYDIMNKVEREYLEAFPEFTNKYSSYICHTCDGVK